MLEETNSETAPKEVVNALVTLYHQKKYEDVLSRSSQLIQKYPNTYSFYNILGAISYEKGDRGEAVKLFRKVIELRPNHPHAYNNLGATLIDLGEYVKALEVFERAIELKPNYAEAYNNIGNVYQKLKKYNQAIENYKQAIKLNSDYYEAHNNMGITLGKNEQNKEAEKILKKVIQINPELVDGYISLGAILTKLQKYEEAEKIIKMVIQINPELADGYISLGTILTNLQKYEEAKKVLRKSIRLYPKNSDSYFYLGVLYSKINISKFAVRYFTKALKFDPKNAEIYYNLGINLTKVGLLKKAARNFNMCLKIDSSHQTASHLYNSLLGFTTKSAPKEYITSLFDYYAKNFEKSLVHNLNYNIPREIKNLLINNSFKSLGTILDLGCGTGLVGLEFKKHCNYIEGVDLSTYMIEEAKQKKIYNKLIQTEIIDYLKTHTLNFDYFLAADVFIYVGDLHEVFRLIKKRNKKSGHLVFSTEHNIKNSYILEKTGRYSHSKNYIKSLCEKFNFTIINFKKTKIRKEKNKYIEGALYNLKF